MTDKTKAAAYHRAYMQAHPGADKTIPKRVRKYKRKHPDRIKARSQVYIKVRAGQLPKLPKGKDYHHGAGYSKGSATRVTPMSHRRNAIKK